MANLPISVAIARGARTIYTLEIVDDLVASPRPGLIDTLTASLNAMLNRQHEQERQAVALAHARGITVHDIRLLSGQSLAYNDFGHSGELVAAGAQAVHSYLDTLPAPRTLPLLRLAGSLRDAWRSRAAQPAPAPAAPSAPAAP